MTVISHISGAAGVKATTSTVTSGSVTAAAGDWVIASVINTASGTLPNTPTASGLTFNAIGTALANGSNCSCGIYVAVAGGSFSGTVTATITSGTQMGIWVDVFRGGIQSSLLDTQASNTATSNTTGSNASPTPGFNNELMVSVLAASAATASGTISGFWTLSSNAGSTAITAGLSGYSIEGTASVNAPTFGWTTSHPYACLTVALKPQPRITSVSPNTGTTGTSVTITGTNLTTSGASGVKFGTNNATSYTMTSDTSITNAIVPAGGSTVDVIVNATGIGNTTIEPSDQFTYTGGGASGGFMGYM